MAASRVTSSTSWPECPWSSPPIRRTSITYGPSASGWDIFSAGSTSAAQSRRTQTRPTTNPIPMAPVKKAPTRGPVRRSTRGAGAIVAHRLPGIDAADWSGIRGSLDGTGLAIAIVCSRFNGNVTGLLLNGALAELDDRGVTEADRAVVWVPGAFELPLG